MAGLTGADLRALDLEPAAVGLAWRTTVVVRMLALLVERVALRVLACEVLDASEAQASANDVRERLGYIAGIFDRMSMGVAAGHGAGSTLEAVFVAHGIKLMHTANNRLN